MLWPTLAVINPVSALGEIFVTTSSGPEVWLSPILSLYTASVFPIEYECRKWLLFAMNKYFSTAQSSHKILYSTTTSIRLAWLWVFHTNISFSRAHEEWGYCQAGTSAILLADKTALIGTPGPHTWRGTVFSVSTSDVSFLFYDLFPRVIF